MMMKVPQELLEFIQGGEKFLVAGHKEPDGDCVGSQLALVSLLRRLGKEALPCSAGPFKRTEILPYRERFSGRIDEGARQGSRVLVLDCTAIDRTGDLEESLGGLPLAVIDHHEARKPERDDTVLYVDGRAPSVTFMIHALIEALGLSPTREEAELLFFGLCTDTGFFRHAGPGSAETFSCAASLVRAGANPKGAYQAIYGGKNFESRLLLGRILSRAKPCYGGRLIISSEQYEETQLFGLEGRDSDTLYQLLQSVRGVEAMAVIREERPGHCTVGLRSRDTIDVAAIAAAFEGGGHRNAAGFSADGSIEELENRLLTAFSGQFLEKF
ncbi:MAG: bifunctional oligoribonuclease/PAP phosphatase NrnA [Treponema sp.]|jgi:phosphoesterase RecJ-like protein|nr:bifunctional oligoribonuclease/PAP phosphatase NrnA [Treponema sp.]